MSLNVDERLADLAEAAAFQTVLDMSLGPVIGYLSRILGERLTRYIAGADSAITLRSWMVGGDVPYINARRLRLALNAALILSYRFPDSQRISAWFTWLCEDISCVSPATVLRTCVDEDDMERLGEVLIAAARRQLLSEKAFVISTPQP